MGLYWAGPIQAVPIYRGSHIRVELPIFFVRFYENGVIFHQFRNSFNKMTSSNTILAWLRVRKNKWENARFLKVVRSRDVFITWSRETKSRASNQIVEIILIKRLFHKLAKSLHPSVEDGACARMTKSRDILVMWPCHVTQSCDKRYHVIPSQGYGIVEVSSVDSQESKNLKVLL